MSNRLIRRKILVVAIFLIAAITPIVLVSSSGYTQTPLETEQTPSKNFSITQISPTKVEILSTSQNKNSPSLAMTINFDYPPTQAAISELRYNLNRPVKTNESSIENNDLLKQTKKPNGALLHCNKLYKFSDGDGTFSVQHACASKTAPWGFLVNPAWYPVIISEVKESGMNYQRWNKNGILQPPTGNMSPHTYPAYFTFHGTFTAYDYDTISYNDNFSFRINISGATGSAQISIRGIFTVLGSTCSPTSC